MNGRYVSVGYLAVGFVFCGWRRMLAYLACTVFTDDYLLLSTKCPRSCCCCSGLYEDQNNFN